MAGGVDVIASISRRPDVSKIEDVLDEHGDEIFSEADSIVIEFDMEVSILKKALDLAEKYNKEVYTVISNMSIAMKRRDLLRRTSVLVCNEQEAGMLFSEDYAEVTTEQMQEILVDRVRLAGIPRIIVTMGEKGAVYADIRRLPCAPGGRRGYNRRGRRILCRCSDRPYL